MRNVSRRFFCAGLAVLLLGASGAAWCNPPRVVSADANVTSLLLGLNAEKYLVAVDSASDLPSQLKQLPRVGYHRNLSAEGLLGLKADVLVGSDHMGPKLALDTLRQSGVKVLALPSPDTPAQLQRNILSLGKLLAVEPRAQALVAQVDGLVAQLQKQSARGHRVAFLLAVNEGRMQLGGQGTVGQALIDALGGQNVAGFQNYRPVTAEGLLQYKPDFVVVASGDERVAGSLKSSRVLKAAYVDLNQRVLTANASHLMAGLSIDALRDALVLSRAMSARP